MKLMDLDPGHRLLVLTWMRDGIEHGIKRSVSTRAYQVFVRGVAQDGITVVDEFDPEKFFAERLKPHEQRHFERVATTLEYLDELIDDCEQELDLEDDQDEPDVDDQGAEVGELEPDVDPDAAVPGFAADKGVGDDSTG